MSFLQCMQNFRSVRFQFFYNPVAKIKKFFQTGYHKQISLIFAFCMQINKQIDYRHNKKTSCPQISSQQNCPDQTKSQQSLQKIQYCTGNDQWVNFFRQEKRQITAFFLLADTHEFFFYLCAYGFPARKKRNPLFHILTGLPCLHIVQAMVQNLLSHIRPGMIDPRKYTIHLQVIPRNGIHASCTLPFFLLYVLHHQLFIHTDFAHALLQ